MSRTISRHNFPDAACNWAGPSWARMTQPLPARRLSDHVEAGAQSSSSLRVLTSSVEPQKKAVLLHVLGLSDCALELTRSGPLVVADYGRSIWMDFERNPLYVLIDASHFTTRRWWYHVHCARRPLSPLTAFTLLARERIGNVRPWKVDSFETATYHFTHPLGMRRFLVLSSDPILADQFSQLQQNGFSIHLEPTPDLALPPIPLAFVRTVDDPSWFYLASYFRLGDLELTVRTTRNPDADDPPYTTSLLSKHPTYQRPVLESAWRKSDARNYHQRTVRSLQVAGLDALNALVDL